MKSFTNTWFNETAKPAWDMIIPNTKPQRILEVGSYEGASLCYLIETLGNQSQLDIHAIDTWAGGKDHISKKLMETRPMGDIEARFMNNIRESIESVSKKIDLNVHKGSSDIELSKLLATGYKEYFDFIYIDGSHESSDVLFDVVVAFRLLKPLGVMAMDDYLWQVDTGANYRPKLAIDAFMNVNFYNLDIIVGPNTQVYIVKKQITTGLGPVTKDS